MNYGTKIMERFDDIIFPQKFEVTLSKIRFETIGSTFQVYRIIVAKNNELQFFSFDFMLPTSETCRKLKRSNQTWKPGFCEIKTHQDDRESLAQMEKKDEDD